MSNGKIKPVETLAGFELLLGVSGGISCYKSADLASKLTQAGARVTVAMTAAAQQFITPLTFKALTGNKVYTSLWEEIDGNQAIHLALTERADLMIIAPATANIIAKIANGIADDLVSTLALASYGQCDILLAPAMNTRMWQSPAVQENVQRLTSRAVHFVGPVEGRLASGAVGIGRMAEPIEIVSAIEKILQKVSPKNSL